MVFHQISRKLSRLPFILTLLQMIYPAINLHLVWGPLITGGYPIKCPSLFADFPQFSKHIVSPCQDQSAPQWPGTAVTSVCFQSVAPPPLDRSVIAKGSIPKGGRQVTKDVWIYWRMIPG